MTSTKRDRSPTTRHSLSNLTLRKGPQLSTEQTRRKVRLHLTPGVVIIAAGVAAITTPAVLAVAGIPPLYGLLAWACVALFDAEVGHLTYRGLPTTAFRFACWILAGMWAGLMPVLGWPVPGLVLLPATMAGAALLVPAVGAFERRLDYTPDR